MPTLPLPIASLIASINAATPPVVAGSSDYGFESLLDIGRDLGVRDDEERAPAPKISKRFNIGQETVAALVQPVTVFATPAATGDEEYADDTATTVEEIAVSTRSDDARSVVVPSNDSRRLLSKSEDGTADAQAPLANAEKAVRTADVAANDNALSQAAIRQKLQELQGVLQSLIQALGALGQPFNGVVQATVNVQTLVVQQVSVQSVSAQALSGASAQDLASGLQALLQQLANLVPTDGSQVSVSATATDSIRGALTSLTAFSASLASASITNDKTSGENIAESAVAPVSAVALKEVLQKTIKAVRAFLRQPEEVIASSRPAIDAPKISLSGLEFEKSLQAAFSTIQVTPLVVKVSAEAAHAVVLSAIISNGTGTSTDNSGGNTGGGLPQSAVPVSATASSSAVTDRANGGFARVLNQVAHPPVLQQVAVQIKTALADGSSKIHIQLQPEELGKLDIRLNVGADGKTGVVITADNKNTLDTLQRDSSGLQRALSDAGLSTDSGSLSFNLRGGQQEQDNAQAAMTYQKTAPAEEEVPVPAVVTRNYVVNINEGLDIRI